MATGIAHESGSAPRGPARKNASGKLVDYGQFIDVQLRRTRRDVKSVEIAGGLLLLAVVTVAFFLLVALLDHWVIRGGLGFTGRLICFLGYFAGAAFLVVRTVLPAIIGRVNPIYAAQAIERTKPSLKNSLINFLLFRRERTHVPQLVYSALEEQAATGLVQVPIETAVDRSRLIHIGYALVALMAAFALYFIFSPKNPLTSVARAVMPWADLPAPARVTIDEIQPGTANAFRGQPVKVSAEIVGLAGGEEAKLLYTTADHQTVDHAIVMSALPRVIATPRRCLKATAAYSKIWTTGLWPAMRLAKPSALPQSPRRPLWSKASIINTQPTQVWTRSVSNGAAI